MTWSVRMNQNIIPELYFFAASLTVGFALAILYDLLRIFRRFIRHSLFFVSVEDFLFWFIAGIAGFYMIYVYNDGIIRLYAIVGMLLAAVLYYRCCSRFVVRFGTWLCKLFWNPIRKGLKKIAKAVTIIKIKCFHKKSGKETGDGKEKQKKKKYRV